MAPKFFFVVVVVDDVIYVNFNFLHDFKFVGSCKSNTKNPYKPLSKLALINILSHLLSYLCNFMNMIMYNEVIYSLL